MYNIEDEELQFSPDEIVNAPLTSVTTGEESNAVAAIPLPVVPAA